MADRWANRIVGEGVEPPDQLLANPRNWRVHPKAQQDALAGMLDTVGWVQRVIVNRTTGHVVDGHLRVALAISRQEAEVPVVYVELSEDEEALVLAALDPLAGMAATDEAMLKELTSSLSVDDAALAALLGLGAEDAPRGDPDEVPEVPAEPITKPGDLWLLGKHRLLCGDSRDPDDVMRLVDMATIAVAFTSPPYAQQRTYDETSGFRPIPPDAYVEWFAPVAANVKRHLAPDGSWFVNIKPACHGLDTDLYVMDLVIAHVRSWGWHFATEFCWERAGVPKSVTQRFKNQFEPIYQFALNRWKMRPDAVRHESDYAITPGGKGSGDTGWGDKGNGGRIGRQGQKRRRNGTSQTMSDVQGVNASHGEFIGPGLAYPGNRLPTFSGTHDATGHAAAFPVGLPEFFVKAYTDEGDVVYDPFMGSGSTLIATEKTNRVGLGMEISPAYCDVIVKRWEAFTGETAVLDDGITDEIIDAFVESH